MTPLMDIPTQEWQSLAEIATQVTPDNPTGLGARKKYIIIKKNEEWGGVQTFHYFDGEILVLMFAPVAEAVRVPPGGLAGQVLVKQSNRDFDFAWQTLEAGEPLPSGDNLLVDADGALLVNGTERLKY